MGKYVTIESQELKDFIDKLEKAAKGDFRKELSRFIEGVGIDFLRIVQDEIIRKNTVDTRLLLNSFSMGTDDNLFIMNDGELTVEVGTNVTYASYANSGHWLNPKGVSRRFVPGHWNGEHFIYEKGAKTGMLLTQKWIEGSHYWDSALRIMESMLPGLLEAKVQQWLQNYFSV